MTVRVITLRLGAGDYYLNELPSYYLNADEPLGRWFGLGAAELGLTGELDDEAFRALMASLDPRDPYRELGRLYTEKSVVGFDATASAPKSVSVLWALGDEHTRTHVLAAHDAAVESMIGWVEDHAHTRFRIRGEVAVVDAEGIVAARFRQHTSRTLDPQLHTHVVIANRVLSPDGRWLALDARTLKLDQRTLSASYHAGLRAELTTRLGVEWKPVVNGIAEIAGVPDVLLSEFSTRTTAVNDRLERKLDRFIATFEREPSRRERWQLEREAAKESRPPKAKAVDAGSLHAAWHEQAHTLGIDIGDVIDDVTNRVQAPHTSCHGSPHTAPLRQPDAKTTMFRQAIEALTTAQSSWRPAELTRELAAAVSTTTSASAGDVREWLEDLSAQMVETCIDISAPVPANTRLRRDGRPVTESAVDRALTVAVVLDQERELLDWAGQRLTHDGEDANLNAAGLTGAQRAAAAAVAGSDDLVLVVGPAGAGKTTALRPAVEHLRSEGRAVFGVAPSATAAQVLREETGVDADTIHKLLIEHNLGRPPDHRYNLPRGATVIVDEAGMLGTDNLADLAQLADQKGWRVAMIGDPLQFSAVDRGGLFGLLVDTYGAVELDQVHRFVEPWERDASLRLRRGDTTVVDLYEQHGRIHCGTPRQMQTQIVNDWWTHRQHGRDVLLLAGTIDDVEALNQRCQKRRVDADELDTRRHLDTGTYRLHPGDEIVTRHNDRKLCTDRGEMLRNGNQWTITAIHPDHTVTATGDTGTVRLPANYITDHVQLGYARTIIAGQGRTVEPCLVYNEGPLSLRALYVAMSRGWCENHVYYGTTGPDTGRDLFVQSTLTDRIDAPAHVRRAEITGQEVHHPGLLDGGHLRQLLEERHSLTTGLETADWIVRAYPTDHQRAAATLTKARQDLADVKQRRAAAEALIERYDRPLYRRRHEGQINKAQRTINDMDRNTRWAEGELGKAQRALVQLDDRRANAGATVTKRPAAEKRIRELDDTVSRDHRARARAVRLHTPGHVIDAIGPRPLGQAAVERWDQAAGRIAQHDVAYGPAAPSGARRVVESVHYSEMSDAIGAVETRSMKRPHPARTIDIDIGISL